jgi:hypothetical protein
MSTSGTYTFTVTRDDIIREAMLNIGKLDAYGSIDPQETTDCARKLNMMCKQWMGRYDFASGLKIWTRQRADLFLSSSKYQYGLGPSGDNWAAGVTALPGQNFATNNTSVYAAAGATSLLFTSTSQFTAGDYLVIQLSTGDIQSTTVATVASGSITLNAALTAAVNQGAYVWNYTTKGQRPLEIVTAILRDSFNTDTPLDYMTIETYEALPTKTQPNYVSDPTAIYYEAQLTNGQLYIDCGGAQDVTKHIHIVYLRPVQDFDNALDNPEYPQEWFNALCWGLSKQICPMFNAVWTPEMNSNYQEAISYAREANPDRTEIYFQPNQYMP